MMTGKSKIQGIVFSVAFFILLLELSVSNGRLDTLLLYLFLTIILYFTRFDKLAGIIYVFLLSYTLSYLPFQITMTHVKNGPRFVEGCLIEGEDRSIINKSTKERRAYSYENSCVFLSDMYSGWRAKYYWVW